jgi:hypothetical protein
MSCETSARIACVEASAAVWATVQGGRASGSARAIINLTVNLNLKAERFGFIPIVSRL